MKRLIIAALAILLVSDVIGSTPRPAYAISDIGNVNVTRLWADGDNGDQFICTAFYVRNPLNNAVEDGHSWVMTAGHCATGNEIKRNADTWIVRVVNWAIIMHSGAHGTQIVDYAIGTLSDDAGRRAGAPNVGFWLAEKMPNDGHAFVHGFPLGVERVTSAEILPADIPLKKGRLRGPSRLILVKKGEITGGSSGAPVMDGQGRVIGVLWGVVYDATEILDADLPADMALAIVTPIERVLAGYKTIVVEEKKEKP